MKIPSPRGGPHASRKRFPWSAPITAPAGREHALLARGLPLIIIIIIALAALVLSSVGHAQTLDPVLVSNTGQTAGSDLALSLEMGQAFRWRRVGNEEVRQGDWGDPPDRWRSNGGAWYSGVLGEYLVHLCRVRACYNRDS